MTEPDKARDTEIAKMVEQYTAIFNRYGSKKLLELVCTRLYILQRRLTALGGKS